MARFDRPDIEESQISVSLDAATAELESFVEQQVSEIIDAAVERAAAIERKAAERAQEVRTEAERKSEEMIEEAFTRAWRILDGIDLLENGVGDMIAALRTEMEGFAADLGSASPGDDRPGLETARSNGADPAPGFSETDNDHAEVEQMIIEQVAILFREGKSRADAERFVMRFKQGEDYLHVLDRIYRNGDQDPPSPPVTFVASNSVGISSTARLTVLAASGVARVALFHWH